MKEKVRVFDIIDMCSTKYQDNYMMKHFKERLPTYIEEGHILKEKHHNINIPEFRINEIFGLKIEDELSNRSNIF